VTATIHDQRQLDGPEANKFSSKSSRCPIEGFTAADRADPYWGNMWATGAHASWASLRFVQQEMRRGAKLPKSMRPDVTPDEALARLIDRGATATKRRYHSKRRQDRLSALAAIGMWRTITAEQLVAITGSTYGGNDNTLLDLLGAGLIEIGEFHKNFTSMGKQHRRIYRPAESKMFESLADEVGYSEWMSITAGMPWTKGPPHTRHNLLATELALRLAEYCDVSMTFGESLSGLDLLSTNTIDPDVFAKADATIIRPDGHRIAIEITSSTGPSFTGKVERWAKTLRRTNPRKVGLSVLFVDASPPDATAKHRSDNWARIRSTVAKAATSEMDYIFEEVPERMAVTRWEWMFPSYGTFAHAMTTLRAQRPTRSDGDEIWETVDLIGDNGIPFTPDDPEAAGAVIASAQNLWGTPAWLRPNPTVDLSAEMLKNHYGIEVENLKKPTESEYRSARKEAAGEIEDDWLSGQPDGDDDDWLS